MKFCFCLLILAVISGGAASAALDGERYALPPTKIYLKPCEQEAMALHPGAIEVQRVLHPDEKFWMVFEITTHEGSKWVVLCDLTSGKIIRDEQEFSDGVQHKTQPGKQDNRQ